MRFEWDEHKNEQNILKHNVSFDVATEIFLYPKVTITNKKNGYGEIRKKSIGEIGNNVCLLVVYTMRKNKIRIISARLATERERRKYYEYIRRET